MTGRPRALGRPKPPDGFNLPHGWRAYRLVRNLAVRPPRRPYRAWGTGKTTAGAHAAFALIRDCVRVLKGLPGPKHKRGRWAVEMAGVQPERMAGWRRYSGLPVVAVARSAEPVEVLLRMMRDEAVSYVRPRC